ncbi:MAG: T9SS type A sorting domain-containing protein [Ignavibacteriae bacterium]|nr:T9SS type A sorting domain-containing protein [Ignavibacteriota bacterium]
MKHILLSFSICCLLFSSPVIAQNYLRMMDDPNVNFYDVVKEADAYFANRDKGKGTGYAPYQRWKYLNENHYYPSGIRNNVSPYFVQEAYSAFVNSSNNSLMLKSAFENGWVDLGPYRVENISGHYAPGLGRIECFYVNPNDTLRIYLGSRSGGFWRTTDGGKTWAGTTDFLFASGVNSITVSPTNPDSILINVRNAGNGVTQGIYRSIDGGLTWRNTKFSPSNLNKGGLGSNFSINRITYSPHTGNMIFISASDGLYRSTDNLNTWSKVTNGSISEIEFHPTNPNIVYIYDYYYWGGNKNAVLRSSNQGQSFTPSSTIVGNNDNTSVNLSVSKSCPDCLFFGSSNGIWKSTDNGFSFVYLNNPKTGNGAFAVNDINPNNMITGGIDVVVSTDGGLSFNQKSWWALSEEHPFNGKNYVHADLRVARSINGVFYLGTDGYLSKSTDGGNTWVRLSEGVGVRENYVVGASQSNTYRNICGSQDNGQSLLTEKGWMEIYGADGMEGIIHPLNADWMIGSWQNGGRRRSKNGAISGEIVTPPYQKNATWVAPLLYDPNNHMHVFSFSDSVYKSENFGTTWKNIGPTTIGSLSKALIAENNSENMLLASGAKLVKSNDGGQSYISVKGLPNYGISDIAFDPKDDNTIIVTYNRYEKDSAKVFISRDFGYTWENITYNLHNMPINSVVIDHTEQANIYLGAEIGVYVKPMSGTAWTLYTQNLPNTSINDLKIQYGTNALRAATWGRGLWEYSLVGRNDYPSIPMVTISSLPTDNQPVEGAPGAVTATVKYNGKLSKVFVKWSQDTPLFTNTIIMNNIKDSTYVSASPLPDLPAGTKIYFKVYAVGSKKDTTETYKFMYTVNTFRYCDAVGADNTTADFINYFSLAGVTNSSANEKYGDFTSKTIDLTTDSSYILQIGMNFHWEPDTVAAWIDYNHNAIFDANEQIVMSELDSLHRAIGKFRVPAKVAKDTTRLRIRSQYWNETPEPCGNRTGEVEDYTVIFKDLPLKLSYSFDQTVFCKPSFVKFRYTGSEVDSLKWELKNGTFKFASYNNNDSVFLSRKGTYSLNLFAYKDGTEYPMTSDKIITVTIIDTSITQSVNRLTANADSATYQWLQCSDNYKAIEGETSKTILPQSDGLYAVEITQNGCIDTSLCYNVKIVGVDESTIAGQTVPLFPNPTTGIVEIELQSIQKEINVSVIDIHGKKVMNTVFNNQSKSKMNISNLSNGIYYFIIKTDHDILYSKIIKNDGIDR